MADNLYQPIIDAVLSGLLWILPLALALARLKVLLRPVIRGVQGEAIVGRMLEKISDAVLHDIILPNGKGGLTQIDHVVLLPTSLLVIETKNYKGLIFGPASERQWTQMLARSKRKQHAILPPTLIPPTYTRGDVSPPQSVLFSVYPRPLCPKPAHTPLPMASTSSSPTWCATARLALF